MKKSILLSLPIALAASATCLSSRASAALITYELQFPTATTWQLVVTDSTGDNAGVFSFGFDAKGISSMNFDGPTATFFKSPATFKTFGFTTNLQPGSPFDPASIDPASTNSFKIAQGVSDPNNDYVYGAGQTAGDTSTLAAPASFSLFAHTPYAAPVVLFDGTRPSNGAVTLTALNGAVFTAAGQGAGSNLNVTPTITTVTPEPASLALIGAGALLVLRRRRAV